MSDSAQSIRCPVIGLVGGIGAGKSTVAAAFARCGGVIVAGDPAGHEALRQPTIKQAVVARWGSQILDEAGDVNRRALGKIVFADPREKAALESLVFPWIENSLREQIAAAQAQPAVPFVILDAAIMLEAGWEKACDRIVFIDTPFAERSARLQAGRGWTAEDLRAREATQMPLAEKQARADAVLHNAGSPQDLDDRVRRLLEEWRIAVATDTLPSVVE